MRLIKWLLGKSGTAPADAQDHDIQILTERDFILLLGME